jgi:uncharacterized OB-fold protein
VTAPSRVEPPADADLQVFWDGTRERALLLPRCRSCGERFWYPRPSCPRCLSPDLDWEPAGGGGTVHALSVMHRPANPLMSERVPYAVVLVDLDEDVRLMSNLVGVDPADAHVGMRVRLTWEALSDGRHLWLFEPGG